MFLILKLGSDTLGWLAQKDLPADATLTWSLYLTGEVIPGEEFHVDATLSQYLYLTEEVMSRDNLRRG